MSVQFKYRSHFVPYNTHYNVTSIFSSALQFMVIYCHMLDSNYMVQLASGYDLTLTCQISKHINVNPDVYIPK